MPQPSHEKAPVAREEAVGRGTIDPLSPNCPQTVPRDPQDTSVLSDGPVKNLGGQKSLGNAQPQFFPKKV